ncbi:MAG: MFS transporter [Burkholderiaceae bacterium]
MKIFYGWRMVGAAGVIQFLQASLFVQAFGLYVALLGEERGWSKTALSAGAALQSIESAVLGPLLGWLVDRFGSKWMLRVGILCMTVGFVMLSLIDSLAGFYVAVVVLAIGASFSGYFPLTVALVHWFERRRARALSLMSVGLAMGGMALPIVALTMAQFGWRATALVSGLIVLLIGLPLTRVFRGTPQEMGENVDDLPRAVTAPVPARSVSGSAQAQGVSGAADEVAELAGARVAPPPPVEPAPGPEFTAGQALRTGAFWWLAFGHGAALLIVGAVNVHAISHIKEGLGYSVTQAAFVITLMTASHLGGLLLGSVIGDRFEKRRIAAFCMLAHAAGLLALTYASNHAMLVAFAILHGGAWGLRGPLMQAIRADYFGRRAFGMILGMSAAVIALGQVAGPLVAGVFVDWTGNYRMGFTVLAIGAALGSLLFVMARPPQLAVASVGASGAQGSSTGAQSL